MASTGKCPFCGAVVTSDQKNCPECGGVNEHYIEDRPRQILHPKTIDELKEYCAERGMPLLRMRFFIGEDCREARAFGIYRDGGRVVVYKNKSDGSRAVRYNGPDEAHAVHEIFQKLLDECHQRGIYPDGKPAQSRSTSRPVRNSSTYTIGPDPRPVNRRPSSTPKNSSVLVVFLVIIIGMFLISNQAGKPVPDLKTGYYLTQNSGVYYYQKNVTGGLSSSWHRYDGGWKKASDPFRNNREADRHYKGTETENGWGAEPFSAYAEPEKGYYLRNGDLFYFDRYWHWFDPEDKEWGSQKGLSYDEDGYIVRDLTEYYLGKEYLHEYPGFEYGAESGYYRWNDTLYYCRSYPETWYRYEGGWRYSDRPVNDTGHYYLGRSNPEDSGCPDVPAEAVFKTGYYIFGDRLLYRSGSHWYRSDYVREPAGENGETSYRVEESYRSPYSTIPAGWGLVVGYPFMDAGIIRPSEDYYQGTDFPDWGGTEYFQDGYYRYGNSTYYYKNERWYSYSRVSDRWSPDPDGPDSKGDYTYEGRTVRSYWDVPEYGTTRKTTETRNDRDDSYSRRDSDWGSGWDSGWDSSDYDDWDSGDTDWDSDW